MVLLDAAAACCLLLPSIVSLSHFLGGPLSAALGLSVSFLFCLLLQQPHLASGSWCFSLGQLFYLPDRSFSHVPLIPAQTNAASTSASPPDCQFA